MEPTTAPTLSTSAPSAKLNQTPDMFGPVRDAVDDGKAKITASLDEFAKAAHDIADQFQANGVGPVAKYAHRGAEVVTAWSKTINDKSLEDLIEDARIFARKKPTVAVGIALAAGFAVSRLFKTGAPAGTLH